MELKKAIISAIIAFFSKEAIVVLEVLIVETVNHL